MVSERDPTTSMPLIGDDFPEITVETTHGDRSLPDDYAGEWLVVFSHPGDFTPVCTSEFVAFEDRREAFEERNASLLGLSVDRVHSHLKWTDWIDEELDVEIGFPIVADEGGQMAGRLGMLQSASGTSTVRAVFLVDPEGIVRQVLYYPEEIGRNVDEILRSLDALQHSDSEGVATPANWPDNERFGDRVLLPPPGSREAVAERESEADSEGYEQYDWWFTLVDE
ncbi:peroxiredoxin [Halococcoides cellulosivorans]|uniref:Peroxiredoxin n=1 Tax=Halococcoides cellulosivorans TaxID=1679096 RepID=A0A2R4WXN0_9EURY|nr:peroxiredoxin [Halococcoides cellulosivorans]AWB26270.1 peroxiredoxin [Halococcoides cellulosivorans]